jgi:hypothetical protein
MQGEHSEIHAIKTKRILTEKLIDHAIRAIVGVDWTGTTILQIQMKGISIHGWVLKD